MFTTILRMACISILLAVSACASVEPAIQGDSSGPYRQKWVLHAPNEHHINSMGWNADGSLLITSGDGLYLWDIANGRPIRKMKARYYSSELYDIDQTGQTIVSTPLERPQDGTSRYSFSLMDVATDQIHSVFGPYSDVRIVKAVFSPEGDVLVAQYRRHENGTFAIFDTKNWQVIKMFAPDKQIGDTLAVSPDNKHLAVKKYDGITYSDNPNGPGFITNGKTRHNYSIQIWNYRTGELVREFDSHLSIISSLSYSPDGQQLVAGGTSEEGVSGLKILNARNGDVIASDTPINTNSTNVRSAAFITNTLIAEAYYGAKIITNDGTMIQDISGHNKPIVIRVCCDGKYIATSGAPSRGASADVVIWERVKNNQQQSS